MAIQSGGAMVLSEAHANLATSAPYLAPEGLGLSGRFASFGRLYSKQLWVYTLVRKRALATRRLPLKVYRRTSEGRQEDRTSPYAELLRRPNRHHPASFLWEWTSSTLDIYGEAMWLKLRGRDGRPVELWPVHPTNVRIERVDGDQAQRWSVPKGSLLYVYGPGVISGSDPQYVIPARDVVHFKTYNPESTVRGLSPLEPLRATLINEDAARRASSAFWGNGARPSGYLSHPQRLSDGALQRLKAQWNDIHGGVDNYGKWAILEEGMEPKVLSLSAEEAQYIESRRLNREEVCAAYDVPPPVVHILDRATFSNITEQMRSMYRDTMAPHIGGLEATLDFQLRPDFVDDDSAYAEFLMDEVLRGTLEERAAAIQSAINSGQLTPNEGRALDNRPAMPGGDRLFINSTMVPIEQADRSVAPPATTQARSLDTLWGRLGCVSSLDDIDPDTLTAGLNGHTELVRAAFAQAVADGVTVAEFRSRLRSELS
jgi:HK97 family phage portal protein